MQFSKYYLDVFLNMIQQWLQPTDKPGNFECNNWIIAKRLTTLTIVVFACQICHLDLPIYFCSVYRRHSKEGILKRQFLPRRYGKGFKWCLYMKAGHEYLLSLSSISAKHTTRASYSNTTTDQLIQELFHSLMLG